MPQWKDRCNKLNYKMKQNTLLATKLTDCKKNFCTKMQGQCQNVSDFQKNLLTTWNLSNCNIYNSFSALLKSKHSPVGTLTSTTILHLKSAVKMSSASSNEARRCRYQYDQRTQGTLCHKQAIQPVCALCSLIILLWPILNKPLCSKHMHAVNTLLKHSSGTAIESVAVR